MPVDDVSEEKLSAISLARSMKHDDPGALFIFLVTAALRGDRATFVAASSAVCDISERGLEVMLENIAAKSDWQILYLNAGMPSDLFPAFYEAAGLVAKPAGESAAYLRARIAHDGRKQGLPEEQIKKLFG